MHSQLFFSLCQAYDYEAFPISANNILFWLIIAGHGIVLLEHLTHHHYQNTEYRRWIPLLALWLYRCTLHLSTWRGKFAYSPAPTPVPFILKWWMICQQTSFLTTTHDIGNASTFVSCWRVEKVIWIRHLTCRFKGVEWRFILYWVSW